MHKNGIQKMIFIKHKKIKGQALMELMISLPLLFTCTVFCLLVFHTYTQKLWADHVLYQALICMAQNQKALICKNQAKKKLKNFLWQAKIKTLKFKTQKNKWKGYLVIQHLTTPIMGVISSKAQVPL